jgi:splicing factor 3B subunit 3
MVPKANGGGDTANANKDDPPPVTAIAMKLLDMRLKPSGAIMSSVVGEFTAPGRHEIILLRSGGALELHRIVQMSSGNSGEGADAKKEDGGGDAAAPAEAEGEDSLRTFLKLITRVETHSVLRSCSVLRMTGEKRDVLSVGADGGCLSVLDFEGGTCTMIHCTNFGKTGCRRATPGNYVAGDPKGRAVMISAIEKRKLVYVLNRDATGKPTIASPLEAHRTRTITFASVGLDNGYDNPIFASLELQYPEEATEGGGSGSNASMKNQKSLEKVEKQLAYYELDLGLNHVSRRWATATHRTACCLAVVPGGADGPGGVLVGGEDWIEYLHESLVQNSNKSNNDLFQLDGEGGAGAPKKEYTKICCTFPRRNLHPPGKGILITTIAVHRQKKSKFFALAQSELGDTYKVTLQVDATDKTKVTGMTVALLDTLPVANALNVSKLGMLFVAAEFGDHALYQFERIDFPDAPTMTNEDTKRAYLESTVTKPSDFFTTAMAHKISVKFTPTMLKNLRQIFTMDNPSPTTSVLVGELAGNEVSPQIYTLAGRGPRSSLRILRHGASVTELAVSELPGVPGGIFTIADNSQESIQKGIRNDKYIVVSFADATLVLSVGETVEEVGRESGFLTNAPTFACSALGNDGALCQVHPAGVRHIQKGQAKQWHCPGLKRIECASANESQVIIALAGGEVIYFELDPMSGNLTESATRDMGADVCCLDVGSIARGRSRSMFAAVGCRDQTVRIVSLEPGKLLTQRSNTALKSRPHSVALQLMSTGPKAGSSDDQDVTMGGEEEIFLTIGLDDGSSLRASVDAVTGAIGASPTRRFLGARPVAVSRMSLEGRAAMLLLSSRPWISRLDSASGKHMMAPLSYAPLDHGCSFSSDAVREGVVATAGKTLRIISVDTAGMEGGEDEAFNTNRVQLRYTPRQMTLLSASAGKNGDQRKVVLAVVESDYNEYGQEEKNSMGFDPLGEGSKKKESTDKDAMDMDEDSDDDEEKKKDEDDEEEEEDEDEKASRMTPIRGPVPPGPGHWGSCVRLLDPSNSCTTLDCIEMNRNEAALCCTSVRFHTRGGESLLAVGTVTGMSMNPLTQRASHVILYRVVNGDRLQLLHRTTVDDGPVLALAHFQGRLLVGIGTTLRLYEMGKRQLLRKCELRGLPTFVKTLQTAGDRYVCSQFSILPIDIIPVVLPLFSTRVDNEFLYVGLSLGT